MKRNILIASLLSLAAVQASAASYELHRVSVSGTPPNQTVVHCHILPGVVEYISIVDGLKGTQSSPFTTDEDAVQALVDAAPGVERPTSVDGKTHTDWWVRSNPHEKFRLIRTSVQGEGVTQDQSAAGQTLAVFLGSNCTRFFGQ